MQAQSNQKDCRKDIWEQAIKKAIIAKTKVTLNISCLVLEMDAYSLWGHYSFKLNKYR